jgi:cell division protein FtsQ
VVAVLALAAVSILAWMIVESPLLDIDHVDVVGAQRVSADDIRAAAKVRIGAAMVFEDLGAIEGRVEKLPWVAHATVSRDWLDRIRIGVTERAPAVWVRRAKDRVSLIDASGRFLGDAPTAPDGLPELRGVKVPLEAGRRLASLDGVTLSRELPAALRDRLVVIAMDRGEATLQLAFAPDVRLGRVEDVTAKLASARAVLDQLGTQRVKYIDVRVPDAPTTG